MRTSPPLIPLSDLPDHMKSAGFAVLDAASTAGLFGIAPGELDAWLPVWDDLPPDRHLKDGGRYRRRRHGSFIVDQRGVHDVPPRAHWQPVEYNALHGGIERWFEPLSPAMTGSPPWLLVLSGLAGLAGKLWGEQRWFTEVHPFRIDTTDGIGRPTPEGAHRDGVDLVAVMLVSRQNVKGGETRVFDARGPQGMRFTLTERWSLLLIDDERVIHESTPIQPVDASQPAYRDTLVVTMRRGGFQGPA